MQIPPAGSAAQAASIVSQTTARDKQAAGPGAGETASPLQTTVEQSGEANPDRDAQGQGDGLGQREQQHEHDEPDLAAQAPSGELSAPAPRLPDEPPSELDLLG